MNLAQLILSRIESAEPQTAILECLKQNEGKRLDKRLLDKLKEATGYQDLYIRQIANMTSVDWANGINNAPVGGSLFIAYKTKDVRIDTAFIVEHNICYFAAREKRNLKRQEALANVGAIASLEDIINRYLEAKAQLDAALKCDLFEADKYTILDTYGLREKK